MRIRGGVAWLMTGWLAAAPALGATAVQELEYSVKASYLVRFAAFVEWPPRAHAGPSTPLIVCVAGRDPFGRALTDAARGQSAHGRQIAVRRVATPAQAGACHVLYVGEGGQSVTVGLSEAAPILRVTDAATTTRRGMIHFVVMSGRVRFHVDDGAARRAGLSVSSRLLGLAVSVDGRG